MTLSYSRKGVLIHFERADKGEVTLRLHLLFFLTLNSASRSKHANIRCFYSGRAFEMFVFHVTVLSLISSFPHRCSSSLSLSSPVHIPAPHSPAFCLSLNVGQSGYTADCTQLRIVCDQLVKITSALTWARCLYSLRGLICLIILTSSPMRTMHIFTKTIAYVQNL